MSAFDSILSATTYCMKALCHAGQVENDVVEFGGNTHGTEGARVKVAYFLA